MVHIAIANFPAVTDVRRRVNARYERPPGECIWSLCRGKTQRWCKVSDADLDEVPQRASICGTDHVPVRTAKIHTTFREKLLRRMLAPPHNEFLLKICCVVLP